MAKNTCPICGNGVDDLEMDFLDNGNPACSTCVQKERKRGEEKNKYEKTNIS